MRIRNYSNQIEIVKTDISKNLYSDKLEDDDMFYFNIKLDEDGIPIVGDGNPNNHLSIMMTSKALIKRVEETGVFHVDCTYKLIKNGFPVLIFGISDIKGQFHPIAYNITSHEDENDFANFFNGLKDLVGSLGLAFNPRFFMQDTCDASYNATKKCFPNVEILMCYFHVCENIRKHKNLLPADLYEEMMTNIGVIHMSKNEKELNENIRLFKNDYKDYPEFVNYVNAQWFTGRYNKWQIFRNDPGMANTNSNIESYNATVKRDYTLRKRLSVITLLDKFKTIVIVESGSTIDFSYLPAFKPKLKEKLNLISEFKFCKTNETNKVKYNGSKETLLLDISENCSCSCRQYLKHRVCIHLVAYANYFNKKLYGGVYCKKATVFDYKAKRGAKGKRYNKAEKALVKST